MNKKILVFFTYNYNLKKWKNAGILKREVKYYENFINETNNDVTFLTYGDNSDKNLLPYNSKIKILNSLKHNAIQIYYPYT